MRDPVSSSSWLNETSRDFVAGVSFTGTVTSPKLIDPVQMVVGTAGTSGGVQQPCSRPTRFAQWTRSGSRSRAASSRCPTSTRSCTPRRASRKPGSSTTTPGSPRSWSPTSAGRPSPWSGPPTASTGERFFEKRCPPSAPAWVRSRREARLLRRRRRPHARLARQPRRARAPHPAAHGRRPGPPTRRGLRPRPGSAGRRPRLRPDRAGPARAPRPARARRRS